MVSAPSLDAYTQAVAVNAGSGSWIVVAVPTSVPMTASTSARCARLQTFVAEAVPVPAGDAVAEDGEDVAPAAVAVGDGDVTLIVVVGRTVADGDADATPPVPAPEHAERSRRAATVVDAITFLMTVLTGNSRAGPHVTNIAKCNDGMAAARAHDR